VFLHGGGWISGDRTMYSEESEWFALQGFACASIDYRLAPLYPFPAAVEDAQAFVQFARDNAARLQVGRLVAFGNSAGGHLAAMLGVGYKDGPKVDAVVDVCGLTDVRNPDSTQFPISMSFVEQFLGGSYVGREDVYAAASPVTYVDKSSAPFLIIHGVEDDVVPVDQSRLLNQALADCGVTSKLVELPGEGHSFTFDAWDRVRSESLDFIRSVLA
jgi:acetyl esterase/lipase